MTPGLVGAAVGVTLLGGLFPIRLPRSVSLLLLGLLVLTAGLVIIPEAWETIGIWFLIPFLIGLIIERYIAPCHRDETHPEAQTHWALAALTLGLLFLHSLLDGHLLAQFQFSLIGLAVFYHKFLDGLSVDLISYDLSKPIRYLLIGLIVLATPLGIILLPQGIFDPRIDGILLSFVSGIYLSSVWALVVGSHHHLHHQLNQR